MMGQAKTIMKQAHNIPQYTAKMVLDCRNVHAECPIWDDKTNELYWIDIGDNKFWKYNPFTNHSSYRSLPDKAGSFALCDDKYSNCILFSFTTGPRFINMDTFEYIGDTVFEFEPELPTMMTDGRVDRNGRFVVGGAVTLKGNDRLQKLTNIYRINHDLTHQIIIDKMSATNSICFSLNGDIMYMTDSRFIDSQKIMKYEYFGDDRLPCNGQIFTEWIDEEKYYNEDNGYHCSIDGSIVDSEGFLWNAEFNGGKVVRYDKNGNVNMIVHVPEPYVTCATFGGHKLDTLYITTSSARMREDEKEQYESVGALYAITLPVKGCHESRFLGKPKDGIDWKDIKCRILK